MRIRLRVAYDGTTYAGFQSQTNGVAIQDVLNGALQELFGHPVKTMGASRTDTGVHARGNVVAFDEETRIAPGKIAFALNARLPEDIRVVESDRVPDDWHPRFQDTVKTYEYHIINRKHPDPLTRHMEMHYYYPLDADAMNRAASYLVGEHDFASFCAAGYSSRTTVRTIFRSEVIREGDRITFYITGTGFLYNMVRIIAGTLIEIGAGKYPPERMPEILEAKDRSAAGPTAIPKGLVLSEIRYPADGKPSVAVIGAGEFQVPLIRRAREMGYCVHAFAWREGAVGARVSDHFCPVSITEKDVILEKCRQFSPKAVLTIASDLGEISVNYLQHALGLPGNPEETAYLATDKAAMRGAFAAAGLSVPRYAEVRSAEPEELAEAGVLPAALSETNSDPGQSGQGRTARPEDGRRGAPLQLPLIIKPADRSGSRGICRVDRLDRPEDRERLIRAAENAIAQSFSGRAVVEEYLEGPEYSAECISQNGTHRMLAVTRKYTTGAPHYIETAHIEPSGLGSDMLGKVRDTVYRALDALRVTTGASHTEFRISPDGEIRLIEAGARMGGDQIGAYLVPMTTGYDYVGMTLNAALGLPLDPGGGEGTAPRCGAAAVKFVMSGEDLALYERLAARYPERMAFLSEDLEAAAGSRQGAAESPEKAWDEPRDSGSRHGYFIMIGEDPEELTALLELKERG